ncbi:MAG: hypothetical protein V4738_04985 [Pseudomonadota bacterium]
MPFHTITFAALLAVASTAFAAGNHGHDHTAKHGGIAVETKQADLEIVARPDLIQIYVDDHGKPVNLDGAKAKVTLLNGTEKSEVALAPAGDKLEAKGAFKVAKGTKGVAVVTLAGKPPATARFELK